MTEVGVPPGKRELELTVLGPGYGESIVLHVGDGAWVVVDSCLDGDGTPQALRYLESIGVDPDEAVDFIVATHWHDDHIRGISRLVKSCTKATFCCASVLCGKEFLAVAHALEGHRFSAVGSGLREIHDIFSQLVTAKSQPVLALANRPIFMKGECQIWSLSPSDSNFIDFLRTVGNMLPGIGKSKARIQSLAPNKVAVALWIRVADICVLLGSDLEKQGWIEILQDAARPNAKASVFKVPHHGSENADEPGVWKQMLGLEPFAVLTPWRRGTRNLPSQPDVQRILSYTTNAYATTKPGSTAPAPMRRSNTVRRTIRESGVKLRRIAMSRGAVRLRRTIGLQTRWQVEMFGSACRLQDCA